MTMDSLYGNIQSIIQNQHGLAFVAVFIGGIVSAASPCVLAAIPLIIGYVGGYSEGNTKKAGLYSLIFVLGLALTFTLLGAAASFMGQLLGFMGKYLYLGLAAIAVIMGIHLMGIFSIPLPFQTTRQIKTKGLAGAFLLGILTGAVSSPCATPVLAVILAYVSAESDIIYGTMLLFVYAIGHCVLIFAAGLSVGIAERIINARGLMRFSSIAKKISGAILVAAGVYIGSTLF